jgi:hypothetical protein
VAKSKSASNKEWGDIGIGDQVKHAKWGTGTVLFTSGLGDQAKAIIVFPEEGQKKVMLKYAGLKKVGSATKSELEAIKKADRKAERARPAPRPKKKAAESDDDDLTLDELGTEAFDDDEESRFAPAAEEDFDE